MGWGSPLIPGSNDGLILLGIPLLPPYAWLAFATMVLSIAWRCWRSGPGRRTRCPSTTDSCAYYFAHSMFSLLRRDGRLAAHWIWAHEVGRRQRIGF